MAAKRRFSISLLSSSGCPECPDIIDFVAMVSTNKLTKVSGIVDPMLEWP